MSDNQKARELQILAELKEAEKAMADSNWSLVGHCLVVAIAILEGKPEALILLQQPQAKCMYCDKPVPQPIYGDKVCCRECLEKQPCKTCGGLKIVCKDDIGLAFGGVAAPCPDCQQPKCEICGGKGKVPDCLQIATKPCPICQPAETVDAPEPDFGEVKHLVSDKPLRQPTGQLPAGEFVRRARLIATHESSKPRTTMEKCIIEACDRLEQLEAEKKALKQPAEQPPMGSTGKFVKDDMCKKNRTPIQNALVECNRKLKAHLEQLEAENKRLYELLEQLKPLAPDRFEIYRKAMREIEALKSDEPKKTQEEIGNVCDRCGKWIDTSSEGVLTESGELLCIECQALKG